MLKKLLSTSQCKIYISLLNILWWTAGIGYVLWATSPCTWTRPRSKWTDSNIKSINDLHRSQDGQLSQVMLRVERFSVHIVTFAFCKIYSVITALKMSPVLMLLSSSLISCQTKNI